jgi:hypothetical protein
VKGGSLSSVACIRKSTERLVFPLPLGSELPRLAAFLPSSVSG